MSDININITADEEPKVHMNIMETVPVGKYEEKANKKQGMEEVTDFEAQFLSAGAIQKIKEEILKKFNDKEDVSNKVNTMDFSTPSNTKYPTEYAVWEKLLLWDNSIKQYVSGFLKQDYYNKEFINESFEKLENKTLGGNCPITHPDCTIAKDEYYASLKYLKECFDYFKDQIDASGGGGNVDLSNYFTKDETNQVIDFARENAIDAAKSEIKVAFEKNKTNNINDSLGSEKCPTVEAVHEYGQSLINTCKLFTTSYVAQEIGNIETALENIIEKYGLGGDAS